MMKRKKWLKVIPGETQIQAPNFIVITKLMILKNIH